MKTLTSSTSQMMMVCLPKCFVSENLLFNMYFLDILVGFIRHKYTATEAEEQVSVCVGPINSNETRHPYMLALLPNEG